MSIGSFVETGVRNISRELSLGELSRFYFFFFFSFTREDGGMLSLTGEDGGEISVFSLYSSFYLFYRGAYYLEGSFLLFVI